MMAISKTIKNPRTSLRRKQTLELIKTTKKSIPTANPNSSQNNQS